MDACGNGADPRRGYVRTVKVDLIFDPAAFRDVAYPFLKADPVRNINILTMLDRLSRLGRSGPDVLAAAYGADGTVVGVATLREGRGFLSDLSGDTIPVLVQSLARVIPDLQWIQAETPTALRFAEEWQALLGRRFRHVVSKRLHRLGTLVPHRAPGTPRLAEMTDHELCVRWDNAFMVDVNEHPLPDVRQHVERQIRSGLLWLWEVDGEPVTMVGHQATVAGTSRVGPVYTPPELRKRGYGSALTAYVSRLLLSRGPEVCLFTDLSNPTSNKIYAAIGYEPVADFEKYAFD
jgi:ribosomal protein S18 acetylase RimI-like enzyme